MITREWQPILFVVSAPSGAGKTTLCERLRTEFSSIHYAITATTRSPRNGEVDGVNYYFLTTDEFARQEQAGAFFETAVVHGNRYGSPKKPVEEALASGKDVLMNLDVQGAVAVRDCVRHAPPGDLLCREMVDIFVVPPSLDVLKNRLLKRGTDSPDTIARRLKQAEWEISFWRDYKYLVINDDLAAAYDNMRAIILAEHQRIRK